MGRKEDGGEQGKKREEARHASQYDALVRYDSEGEDPFELINI